MKKNTKIKILSFIFGIMHFAGLLFSLIFDLALSLSKWDAPRMADSILDEIMPIIFEVLSFPLIFLINHNPSVSFNSTFVFYALATINSILWGIVFYTLIKALFGDKKVKQLNIIGNKGNTEINKN